MQSVYKDVIKPVEGNTGFQPKVTVAVNPTTSWRPGSVELSWSSYGSVDVAFAKKMYEALGEAITLAEAAEKTL